MTVFLAANERFEAWLRTALGAEVVEADLVARRAIMAGGPFAFFRATYWRWAETIDGLWIPAQPGIAVLAVGDVHLENYGTWRDAEGRLVWGVNDHDEAAEMPWPLDLLRLATSAVLAAGQEAPARAIAAAIMAGYREGLSDPRPIVLDHDFAKLRTAVLAARGEEDWDKQDKARDKFWNKKMAVRAPKPSVVPPPRILAALRAALPAEAREVGLWPRSAGAGSLGRPRWVLRADWQGGPIIREAKAMLPSAWLRSHPGGVPACRAAEVARGAHRAPDPCLSFQDAVAVRRLSPNNAKLEAKKAIAKLLAPEMLHTMARDIAAIHAATAGAAAAIAQEIAEGRPLDADGAALAEASTAIAAAVRQDEAEVPPTWRAAESEED